LCGFEKIEAKGTIWKNFKECQIMSNPERVKPTSARLLPVKAQPASVSRGIVTFAQYRHFLAISVRPPNPQIIDFAHLSRRTPYAFDK
jgi:hypothetical protein